VDEYLLTHPVTDERINYVLNFVKQNPGADKPSPPELERNFKMVKAKVMGFLQSPEKVRIYYQNQNGPDAAYAKAVRSTKRPSFRSQWRWSIS
jgi:predicted Zn-dependent protease